MIDKKALRREVREIISGFDEVYVQESDAGVFSVVSSIPEFINAPAVFAYNSVGREVDTSAIIRLALEMGKSLALPVVYPAGIMEFAVYEGESDSFVSGSLGIPEPGPDASRFVPQAGDILLVPALCFDRSGYRLGQGGGYYDRFLSGCPAFTLGLARQRLLMESVPREDHDLPVDLVVTENGVVYPG